MIVIVPSPIITIGGNRSTYWPSYLIMQVSQLLGTSNCDATCITSFAIFNWAIDAIFIKRKYGSKPLGCPWRPTSVLKEKEYNPRLGNQRRMPAINQHVVFHGICRAHRETLTPFSLFHKDNRI